MEAEKKPTLSVDAEGTVLKCAKGADVAECGYKGGPVCPKCGATPVQVKMVPLDELDEKAMTAAPLDEEDMEDEEMSPAADMKSKKKGMKKPYKKMGMDPEDMMDEDMVDAAKKGMGAASMEDEDMEDEEYEEEEEDDAEMEKTSMMRDMRKRRINTMGMKAADLGETGYICAIERKAHPGASSVCDDCPGGCIAEKGLPGLLEVEGIAETEFKGVVIDSGYSADAGRHPPPASRV